MINSISAVSQTKVRLIFGAQQVAKIVLMNNVSPKDHAVLYNLRDISVRRHLEKSRPYLLEN